MYYALVFVGGVAAGFINVIAGGGSLITMPLLVFCGLPETSANGTARLGILVQNGAAVARYQREGAIDWRTWWPLTLPVAAGATAGAWAGTQLSATGFRGLLGAVTLIAGAAVAFDLKKRLARDRVEPTPLSPWLLAALLVVGFYGGMIQAGVGYLILAALTVLGGLGLVRANVLKVLLILAYTPLAVGIFAAGGHVDLLFGAVLAGGQAIGAWVAAGLALKRGATLIRWVLFAVLLATAAKLIHSVL